MVNEDIKAMHLDEIIENMIKIAIERNISLESLSKQESDNPSQVSEVNNINNEYHLEMQPYRDELRRREKLYKG